MFLSLLGIRIGAGLVDSLNPIAIAQQFVLQSTAKSKHSILTYIFGIGLTNFIFGLLFYFGLAQIIRNVFESVQTNSPFLFPLTLIIIGVMLIINRFITIFQREIIKQRLRMRK